jgi:hypothetical protein
MIAEFYNPNNNSRVVNHIPYLKNLHSILTNLLQEDIDVKLRADIIDFQNIIEANIVRIEQQRSQSRGGSRSRRKTRTRTRQMR